VPLAIQNDHRQVFNIAAQPPGDVPQVVFHRRVDVDYSSRGRSHDDLVHVDIRRVQQASAFGCCQDRDCIVSAQRAKVRAFEWIYCNIDFGTGCRQLFADAEASAYFFADEEHRRLVAFSFTNDDAAAHRHRVHHFAHRFDGNLIRILSDRPGPMVRAAAIAAASVTRRKSRDNSRSVLTSGAIICLLLRRRNLCDQCDLNVLKKTAT
jgi:hypothetical protein